jgi:hypothetical protein
MKTTTETLIAALRELADVIQSPDDVPQVALREAADRLAELDGIADKRGAALTQINLLVEGYLSGHPGHRTMTTIRDIIAEVEIPS